MTHACIILVARHRMEERLAFEIHNCVESLLSGSLIKVVDAAGTSNRGTESA